MRENRERSLFRSPGLRKGLSIGLAVLCTSAARAGASPPLSRYRCENVGEFLERSEAAFPPSLDPHALLEYPVRDALKELREKCLERELSQAEVREAIEKHVTRSLAAGQSRLTMAIVSFAWCPACRELFSSYGRLARKQRSNVRFVFLDGDAYDGGFDPARDSPFSQFVSGACRVRVLPFYPAYCVLDDRGRPLEAAEARLPQQSYYGARGLRLAMKAITRALKQRSAGG